MKQRNGDLEGKLQQDTESQVSYDLTQGTFGSSSTILHLFTEREANFKDGVGVEKDNVRENIVIEKIARLRLRFENQCVEASTIDRECQCIWYV